MSVLVCGAAAHLKPLGSLGLGWLEDFEDLTESVATDFGSFWNQDHVKEEQEDMAEQRRR